MKPVPGPVEGWTFERSSAGLMIAITESGDWSTCVGIDGGTLTVFTGRPEVRIPIAVVRALLADEVTEPLTVGAALADAMVQDGECVVEYTDAEADGVEWLQVRVVGSGSPIAVRIFGGSGWSRWQAGGWRPWGCDVVAPCRLVPLADADAPPESRGSM